MRPVPFLLAALLVASLAAPAWLVPDPPPLVLAPGPAASAADIEAAMSEDRVRFCLWFRDDIGVPRGLVVWWTYAEAKRRLPVTRGQFAKWKVMQTLESAPGAPPTPVLVPLEPSKWMGRL